jgi:hypothetical protein
LIFLRISTHSTRLEVAHHLEDPSDADKRIDDTEQSAVGASLVAALRVGCVIAQERGPRIDEAYAVQWCEEQPVSCGSLRMPGMGSRTFDSYELQCTEAPSGRTAFHLISTGQLAHEQDGTIHQYPPQQSVQRPLFQTTLPCKKRENCVQAET